MTTQPAQVGDDRIWAEVFSSARPGPALFLDRDGVVVEEKHFLADPALVTLTHGAADVIARANAARLHVVLVTNQSGIARGKFGWPEFAAVQDRLVDLLRQRGARLDAVMACPFHADGRPPFRCADHPCRKPNPGLLIRAAEALSIELSTSWIVGDRTDDIGAGRAAGLAGGVHVGTGYGREHRAPALALATPDYRVLAADSIADLPGLAPILPATG